MKSCFMFGHSDCPPEVMPRLEAAVEQCCTQYGVTHFYVGNRGQFDSMAAKAVAHAKRTHPEIYLHLVLAYHPAERPADLWGGFDDSFYPPLENVPRPYAIVRANQYMIDTSDHIICYAFHVGNARNLLEYAQKHKKTAGHLHNVARCPAD